MAQKKSTASKAKATVEKKETQGPTEPTKTPVAKAKPAPKAKAPAEPKAVPVTKTGLYQIKMDYGASNVKAVPLPGKRVLIVVPGSSVVVDDLEVVQKGNAFHLK